ncbi:hypothetical protein B9479_004884 [Cryptococcus floricola]|uniref:Uncharacterized protein n=1 Tax=Cryptococcus floricola TaxID=2591691 RepID=A0A5D3ASI6_9TREE|nr:hypothetical protein B9479_004884 [Cryptococcus floricola]
MAAFYFLLVVQSLMRPSLIATILLPQQYQNRLRDDQARAWGWVVKKQAAQRPLSKPFLRYRLDDYVVL